MINWLRGLYGDAVSGLEALKRWVLDIFQAVYSYLDGLYNAIVTDITYAYQYVDSLYHYTIDTLGNFYSTFVNLIYQYARDIEGWVTGLLNNVYEFIGNIVQWVQGYINEVITWIGQEVSNLANWVLQNVWDPLWNAITDAYNWIAKYGYYMYWLLTHPDQLALLLGKYILAAWYQLGRQYAPTIGRFLLHSMISAGSEFGGILSDIIASII